MKARVESARSSLNQHVRLTLALFGLALVALVIFVPVMLWNSSAERWSDEPGPVDA